MRQSATTLLAVAAATTVTLVFTVFRWRRRNHHVRHVVVSGLARLKQFSHASIAKGTVYVSGCIGIDIDRSEEMVLKSTLAEQTKAALEHVRLVLEESGSSLEKLVKVNVYLSDNSSKRFQEMNLAYDSYFRDLGFISYPARITVGCGYLALGALVEVDAIAVL